ncbi:unnamed protein product [Hymenolepis diminuta]|uniref:Phosphotransferase n=1 Tax=Hymenolepis diminuta TaxID=6216 RepID=A0A158QG93_HYMDI|nr:unnamed protein product [Hymenolepis diminuta]
MQLSKIPHKAKEICSPFWPDLETCRRIMILMHHEMNRCLDVPDHPANDFKMLNTYVTQLPQGNETGQYLALDLGGTNYRVLLITFDVDSSEPTIEYDTERIPPELMTGKGDELFQFIAKSVKKFLTERELLDVHFDMGFTFSFPVKQTSINRGTLIRWTKGFSADDVVGKDVVEILNRAMSALNLNVTCRIITNDTVGALASCKLTYPDTVAGVIVGTGTNAAFASELPAGPSFNDLPPSATYVVINTEWGAFGDHGLLDEFKTEFDRIIDEESKNPGKQTYEKMISGMYLGEITRHILRRLVNERILLQGNMPEKWNDMDSIPTSLLSDIARDPDYLFYNTERIIREHFNVTEYTDEDLQIIHHVGVAVANRAALYAGTGVACLVNRIKRREVTVGVDGSLFKLHPNFPANMLNVIRRLANPLFHCKLQMSEDGSGKGAGALVASLMRHTRSC